jgi:aspartate aminotransferase
VKISDRVNSIEGSKSVEMAQIIIEMRSRGEKVISFNVGEPDFDTAPIIIEETKKALEQGKTRYSSVPGEKDIREKIISKVNTDQDLDLSYQNVALSNGSKQVLYSLFQLLCNPGDEVIVPRPYWLSFPEAIKLSGATPVFIEPLKNNRICIENIIKSINSKTKAIILNSPNNPTGLIEDESVVKEITALAKKHNFMIISDEAYEAITFDNKENISSARFDKDLDNTIIVQSFSKNLCMTGFRLGYFVAHKNIIQSFIKLQSHICGNPPPFAQAGALAGLENEKALTSNMRQVFQNRRDLAFSLCSDIFPETEKPDGAFYLFPRLSQSILDKYKSDVELAMHILKNGNVALLPGSYFGMPDHLRICFAASDEDIKAGFKIIKDIL